jgi:hypothetical protein
MIAIALGDHQTAFQQFVATLSAADRIGAPPLTAYALLGLALCATARGDAVQAAQIHGAADKLFEEIGLVPEKFEASLRDIDRDRIRNALGDDLFLAAFTAGRSQPTDEAIAMSQQLPHSPARGAATSACADHIDDIASPTAESSFDREAGSRPKRDVNESGC